MKRISALRIEAGTLGKVPAEREGKSISTTPEPPLALSMVSLAAHQARIQ
jgi:hypothetical protein